MGSISRFGFAVATRAIRCYRRHLMLRAGFASLLVCVLCAAALSAATKPPKKANASKQAKTASLAAPSVQSTNYFGHANSFLLSGSAVRAAVVPELGGRILEYSLNGDNILFQSPALTGAPAGQMFSGYQCDIGPELRGIPSHPALWDGPWQSRSLGEVGVRVSSPSDPALHVALEKEILVDPESGDLGLVQRVRNTATNHFTGCLWDRTLCQGGGYAFFPLKKKSHFAAGWSLMRKVGDHSAYDGAKPQHPNVQILNGVLVAKCEGDWTKLGADSEAGWIAYVRGRLLFVKYFPYTSKGNYTDGGNSVELYFDHDVAELEPLSPEVKLAGGETYDFPEKWLLIDLTTRVTSFTEARALVSRIPDSPF